VLRWCIVIGGRGEKTTNTLRRGGGLYTEKDYKDFLKEDCRH
jgi:hypothetical protein